MIEFSDGHLLEKSRNDPASANRVLLQYYPKLNERVCVARILAHAIQTAHMKSENSWSVTLKRDESLIRLNVGRTEVLVLTPSNIYTILARQYLPDDIWKEFGIVASENRYSVPIPHSPCLIPSQEIERVYSQAQKAHDEFVCAAVRNASYARSHSQGIIRYLREFLKTDIPSPGYLLEEPTEDEFELRERTAAIILGGRIDKPIGSITPRTIAREIVVCERDPKVRAWVLQEVRGICELCQLPAPFKLINGEDYLEVHHVKSLSDNGSDNTENAVALCPNCHRALHYAINSSGLKRKLYEQVPRLMSSE